MLMRDKLDLNLLNLTEKQEESRKLSWIEIAKLSTELLPETNKKRLSLPEVEVKPFKL